MRYNQELYGLYESDIIKMVKAARLRWLGHLYRTKELNPRKKLTFSKPMGTRKKRKTTSKMVGQCSKRSANSGG
jgi:hypothetical protein